MTRCINIDWLEVFAHEVDKDQPRDAEYFRALGFSVEERPYGTRQYEEMFTLLDDWGEKWIEVRRKPKGLKTITGFSVLDEGSCHIRLCNRTCYCKPAAQIMIDFCDRYGFIISRISRLDICLDFEYFDYGDNPQDFLNRYLKGRYSKINQANISAHGKDLWDGRFWNSLSWGSPVSQIGTKFYNKTLELNEKRDKPYIRQAWAVAGLIDDMTTMEKRDKNGQLYKPEIWRLEFSIKSSTKRWYIIEDTTTAKRKLRSIHHDLADYTSDDLLMRHFVGLVDHYFHFKMFVAGQRKDRCPDKRLFNFTTFDTYYSVEHVSSARSSKKPLDTLRNRLLNFRLQHPTGPDARAIDAVLDLIKTDILNSSANGIAARNEQALLQALISTRLRAGHASSLADDIEFLKSLLTLSTKIF